MVESAAEKAQRKLTELRKKISQMQPETTMRQACASVGPLQPIRLRAAATLLNAKESARGGGSAARGQQAEPAPAIPVNCVHWNVSREHEHQFLTADDLGFVTLWDGKRQSQIARQATGMSLSTGCIEPTLGQQLLCGGTSDSISLFEVNIRARSRAEKTEKMSLVKEYQGHSGNVTSCGFLSTEYFVTSSQDSTIGLWQVDEQRFMHMYNDHSVGIEALDVFQMDGNVFASGSNDLTFRVWDIRMKKACFHKSVEGESGVCVVKFMPENINSIAVGNSSEVGLWDLRALGRVCQVYSEKDFETAGSVAFSKSGRLLFCQYPSKILVWDLLREEVVGEFGNQPQDKELKSISLSENGQVLLSAGIDGSITQWTL